MIIFIFHANITISFRYYAFTSRSSFRDLSITFQVIRKRLRRNESFRSPPLRAAFSFMLIASFPVRSDAVCGLSNLQRTPVNERDLLVVEIKKHRGVSSDAYSHRFECSNLANCGKNKFVVITLNNS